MNKKLLVCLSSIKDALDLKIAGKANVIQYKRAESYSSEWARLSGEFRDLLRKFDEGFRAVLYQSKSDTLCPYLTDLLVSFYYESPHFDQNVKFLCTVDETIGRAKEVEKDPFLLSPSDLCAAMAFAAERQRNSNQGPRLLTGSDFFIALKDLGAIQLLRLEKALSIVIVT